MICAAGAVFATFLLVTDRVEASQEANCTFRKIPLIALMVACQQKTPERVDVLKRYWREEDTRTLCHYFYFPIVDPRASRSLLAANFSIMAKEIAERGWTAKRTIAISFGIAGLTPEACLKNTRWLTKRAFLKSQIVVPRVLLRREAGNCVHVC